MKPETQSPVPDMAAAEACQSVRYEIFQGVTMTFMDMHTARRHAPLADDHDILEIDYCQNGCMECTLGDQTMILSSGDVLVHKKFNSRCETSASLNHFHGISLAIHLYSTDQGLKHMLHDLNIDPMTLREKYCEGNQMTLFRSSPALVHVFSMLYSAPEALRCSYAKVKMPELLLFLDTCPGNRHADASQRRFSRYAVTQTKAIGRYLTENTDQPTTIAELSRRFCISQTVLKECFKRMYGESVASFFRRIRMEKAGELLRSTDLSILEIAMRVGYSNASKFAKVFHGVMGCNPNEYRRQMD